MVRLRRGAVVATVGALLVGLLILSPVAAGASRHHGKSHTHHKPSVTASPGCSQFCLQAGPSAGNNPLSESCPSSGCVPCPSRGCLSILSRSVTVQHQQFLVSLDCQLSEECDGAFVMYTVGGLTLSDRLAGSDFTVPAGKSQNVPIQVSELGEQAAASSRSGYQGAVYVDLQTYGSLPRTSLVLKDG